MINTHDHRPAHVHVWHQGEEAIIVILDDIHVRSNDRGFGRRNLAKALRIVEECREHLLEEWNKIHEQIQS